jgi:hypothetical protein
VALTFLANVGSWPIATNFTLGLDVSFRGKAEVRRAAESAASVESDPHRTWALRTSSPDLSWS